MRVRSLLRYSHTFWMLSSTGSKPRKFTITGVHILIFVVLLSAGLAGSVRVGMTVADAYSRSREFETLRARTQDQAVQLQSLQARMDDLNIRLERLRASEAKVRSLLGAKSSKRMGGPELPERAPRREGQATVGFLDQEIDRTVEAYIKQEVIFQDLIEEAAARNSYWAAIPSLWPVHGRVTSGFGHRISPFSGNVSMHSGVDIAAPMRAVVRAPADGIVTFAGFDSGLGQSVRIFHGYGMETLYGHLSSIAVRKGQRIRKGAKIGAIGSTGLSTGPHLHYQVARRGVPVNPLRYLLD